MKPRTYAYLGGALLAVLTVAAGGWGPAARDGGNQKPVFAVDPSWPNPLMLP